MQLAEAAVHQADAAGDTEAWSAAAISLVIALWAQPASTRQVRLAAEMERRAVADAELVGARWSAAPRLCLGDRPGYEAAVQLLREQAGRRGLHVLRAYGLQGGCLSALLDRRYIDADHYGDAAVEAAGGHPNFTRIRASQVFWSASERNALAELEPLARAVVEANYDLPVFHAMLGLILCDLDQLDEASHILDRLAGDEFEHVPRDILWTATIAASAEIAASTAADEHVGTLAGLLEPYGGQLVVVAGGAFVYGAVDRFRAMLAARAGDAAEATAQFDAAVELEHAIGAPGLEARTRVWRARSLGRSDEDTIVLEDLCARHDLPWAASKLRSMSDA